MKERTRAGRAARRPADLWRTLYWPAGLATGSLLLWFGDPGGPASFLGSWALLWPWLIAGWWAIFPVASLFAKPRLRFMPVETGCMVTIALAGTLLTGVTHLAPRSAPMGVGFGHDLDLFDLLGESFILRDRLEREIPPGSPVEVRNVYGSVRVVASGGSRIVLGTETRVRAAGSGQAVELASGLSFRIEERDGVYLVRSNHDTMSGTAARRFRTRLSLEVPAESAILVDNRRGWVEVSGFAGPQTVRTRDGRLAVRAAGGSLEASVSRGDARIVFEGAPEGLVSVAVEDGDLRLALPADSGFSVSGEIRSGSFDSSLGAITANRAEGDLLVVTGRVGDAAGEVRIEAAQADVRLSRTGRWMLADWLRRWLTG